MEVNVAGCPSCRPCNGQQTPGAVAAPGVENLNRDRSSRACGHSAAAAHIVERPAALGSSLAVLPSSSARTRLPH